MSFSMRTCFITRTRCKFTSNDLKEIYMEDFNNQMNNGIGKSSVNNLVG